MKRGTGDDPFANDTEDDVDEDDEDRDLVPEHTADVDDKLETDDLVGEPPQPGADDDDIPWVYTRGNVKQDRDMVQFYLRRFVQNAEHEFVDAVADELGTDVSKTDVREAAYVAAMRNPDLVAEELERWGFEHE